jgi:hypothetical protein
MSTDIAKSKRVKVFAVPEVTPGTLVFPSAEHFICPAGEPSLNQVPTYTDSKELADTLDVLDQFPDAMPPAEFSLPMYLRMAGSGAAPQGDILFQSMQGSKQESGAVTAAVNAVAGIDADDVTIPYDTVAGGELPPAGVIQIGAEKIRYAAKTATNLTGCTRGYAGTTAASALDDASITLLSQVYKQATASPACSLWIMRDWFILFCSGATVNNAGAGLKNEDAILFNLKGQGMRMGWAGQSALTEGASAAATQIVVANAKVFTVGARIQNVTKGANNAGAGFAVTAVNVATKTLTLATAVPSGGWAENDVIRGYLPDATPIGTAVKCRDTKVYIGGVEGRIRSTDLTIDVPKTYLTDVIGTPYPEEYVEDTRKITTNLNVYFKKADAEKFYAGFNGEETTVEFILGDTPGYKCSLFYPRVKLTMPTLRSEGPTVVLEIPVTALGTAGEDSFYMCLE